MFLHSYVNGKACTAQFDSFERPGVYNAKFLLILT